MTKVTCPVDAAAKQSLLWLMLEHCPPSFAWQMLSLCLPGRFVVMWCANGAGVYHIVALPHGEHGTLFISGLLKCCLLLWLGQACMEPPQFV